MVEYQAILIGALIGFIGSIIGAAVMIGKVKPTIIAGFVGLVLGAAGGYAVAQSFPSSGEQRTIQAPFCLASYFFPTGWMGDAEYGLKYIEFEPNYRACGHEYDSDSSCIRIHYTVGPSGWAGIYWQYPENNWGDYAGTRIENARRISFRAKGAFGGELVEFKTGGINASDKPFSDKFMATLGQISLSDEWHRYEINLAGQNLSGVLGAFAVVFPAQNNGGGKTIFIDDIKYE